MADIKQLTVKGVSYNIKDAQARQLIAALHNIQSVFANITGGYGTPSVDVQYANDALTLTFHNLVGNGITSIQQTASPNEDEGVNRYLVTMSDGITTELTAKNGHRGNGIVSIEQIQSSQADNGENIWQITDTDGNVTNIVLYNGHQPSLTDVLGDDSTIAMSQKGVTNALRYREVIEFEKFYNTYGAKFIGSRSTNNGVKIESGTAKVNTIYGVTFVWNQLFDTVGTTVTPVDGCAYLLQIDGVRSIVVADANTSAFVSTTATDMCINLRHLYGAENGATPFTIAQFEEFFPLPYYSYDAGRLINMAITSFTSQGTDKDGNVFYKAINLPITTMTGKLNGIGNSETIFSNGMGNAYGLPSSISNAYADSITKVGGVWKATQRTHFVTINLANVTWSNAGYNSSLYSATSSVMPIGTGDTSSINVVCDKFVSRRNAAGNFVKGYTAMYPGSAGNNTFFVLCRDEPKTGVANFAYPKKTASTYVLDDEYQAMLNEVFATNDGGTEIVYPSNGVAPTTTPAYFKIDYPIVDYTTKKVCVDNWGGNYVEGEITRSEAKAVTSLASKFYGRTGVISFDELKYFTSITSLFDRTASSQQRGQFYNCTGLTKVTLPAAPISNLGGAFRGCTALTSVDLSPITYTGAINCTDAFSISGSNMLTIKFPSSWSCSSMQRCFQYNTKLTTIDFGTADFSSCSSFATAFLQCSALTTILGTISGINVSIDVSPCPLTTASALILVNGLSSTGSGKTLTLKASKQATYEADADFNAAVIAATANGWTIAYA